MRPNLVGRFRRSAIFSRLGCYNLISMLDLALLQAQLCLTIQVGSTPQLGLRANATALSIEQLAALTGKPRPAGGVAHQLAAVQPGSGSIPSGANIDCGEHLLDILWRIDQWDTCNESLKKQEGPDEHPLAWARQFISLRDVVSVVFSLVFLFFLAQGLSVEKDPTTKEWDLKFTTSRWHRLFYVALIVSAASATASLIGQREPTLQAYCFPAEGNTELDTSQSLGKEVLPFFSEAPGTYREWRRRVSAWSTTTTLAANQRGAKLIQCLKGEAWRITEHLNILPDEENTLHQEEGVRLLRLAWTRPSCGQGSTGRLRRAKISSSRQRGNMERQWGITSPVGGLFTGRQKGMA